MKVLNIDIRYVLAIMWTLFVFWVYGMYATGNLNTEAQISILIINSVTNIIMLIVGYFFGSSKGSNDKTKQLHNDTIQR